MNEFDEENVTFITGILDDNGNPTGSTSSHYTENYYEVKPNTSYTWSGTITRDSLYNRIYFYDENKNWLSRTAGHEGTKFTFDTPSNCHYIRLQTPIAIDLKAGDVKLEKGTKATPYSPYGCGNINEKVQNKNLTKEIFEVKLRVSNSGSNRVVQTATHKVSQIIRVKPSTTYVIDGDFTKFNDGNCRARCFKDFPVLGNTDLTKPFAYATQRFTITTDATTNYIMIYDSQDNKDVVIPNMFVCEQQYADTYIPHAEQNISFPLEEGQIVTQNDYIDDDGIHHVKWSEVLDGVNKKVDLAGTFNNVNYVGYLVEKKSVVSTDVIKPLCTHFQGITNGRVIPGYCYIIASGTRMVLVLTDQTITTVEAFNNWLQEQYNNGTPVEIEYDLAEEVVEPFTEEQAEAWELIKKAKTYKTVTHISSEDETPATMDMVYVRDLQTYLDNLNTRIEVLESEG